MNLISTSASIYDATIRKTTREEEIALRNSDECVASVKAAMNGDLESKKMNYYRCPNAKMPDGVEQTTRNKNNLESSNKVFLDYDFTDWQSLWDNIKDRTQELGIFQVEMSARNKLHMMARRIEGLNNEQTIIWYEKTLGIELDHSAKDLARACFLVPMDHVIYCDDDLYYADSVEPQTQDVSCVEIVEEQPAEEDEMEELEKLSKEIEEY